MSIVPNYRADINNGVWLNTATYGQGDVVAYQGASWISNIASNAGHQPGQDNSWTLFARAGQDAITNWRGVWQSTTSYNLFDAVSYLGSSYVSIVPVNQNNVPTPSSSQWAVLAQSGGTGPAGSFTFLGVWDSATQYHPDNIVSYLGSSYVATNTPPISDVPTDTTFWALIAEVGSQGPAGNVGSQGATGLGFTWKGAWSNLTSYHLNDVVGLLGTSYVAVQANLGVDPSTDGGSNWQIIAQAGTPGQTQPQFQVNGVNLPTPISILNFAEGSNMTISNVGGVITFAAATQAEPVTSVFGRTGAVVAVANDYSFAQISGLLTVAQISATGTPSATTFLRGDGFWGTLPVTGVFGRFGNITAQVGDYSAFYDALGAAATAQSNAEAFTLAQGFELTANKGVANGYASLNGIGNVPLSQLPIGGPNNLVAANSSGFVPRASLNFQTVRIPFTPLPTDITNQYINVTVTFPQAFADANYTLTTDLQWDTASTPVWQANNAYALNDAIVDSNGMLQVVTTPGTSGATQPTWATASGSTTNDGTVVWTLEPVTLDNFIGIAKFKTASGFIEEMFISVVAVPLILHVTAWHD